MHHPDVKFMVPTEDVCATCERLRNLLRVELSGDGKVSLSNQLKSHVELAQAERAFYNKCIEDAKASPNTSTHLTFDFSENFGIPYHSRQPGPVYFKVLFRINDFGIANEAKKEQVHHLFDETQTIGKDNSKNHGPNCVVSMLDHYLQGHQHARSLHAHCDNCCGQNKNKTVMAYFCWRVLAGLEDEIKVSFMVVGHTRCAVDGGFGTAKKKFRSSDCDTPKQLSDLITSSASSNKTDCFTWQWRNWDAFLGTRFRKVEGITQYQHFFFSKDFPGKVKMAKHLDRDPVILNLCKTHPPPQYDATVLPEILPPAGLSDDRRGYLVKNVLDFCHPENKDAFQSCM